MNFTLTAALEICLNSKAFCAAMDEVSSASPGIRLKGLVIHHR